MLFNYIQKSLVYPAVILASTDGDAKLPIGIEWLAKDFTEIRCQIRVFGDCNARKVAFCIFQSNAPLRHLLAAEISVEKISKIGTNLTDKAL